MWTSTPMPVPCANHNARIVEHGMRSSDAAAPESAGYFSRIAALKGILAQFLRAAGSAGAANVECSTSTVGASMERPVADASNGGDPSRQTARSF